MTAIVFDLGGTFLRCGVATADGTLSRCRKSPIAGFLQVDEPRKVVDGVVRQMLTYVAEVNAALGSEAPIVISFPGPIRDHTEVLSAPSVVGPWRAFPHLASTLRQATGRAIYLLNDLSAAARFFATTTNVDRFLVVSVSSGIGSKVFDRRHPAGVLDDIPYAGEIGHWTVDSRENAPVCDCGARGHLQAIASGRGIERAARRSARQDPMAFQRSACATSFRATPESLTNEAHLIPAALLRDEWALRTIRACTAYLANAVLGAILTVGLQELIVIGGFALALGDQYLDLLRDEVRRLASYSVLGQSAPDMIRLGTEIPEACLAGAALYARSVTCALP